MRHDFSMKVKRDLADRAGHKCSVCGKATTGPSSDPAKVISDGVAAHITAAAPRGPRFDKSLSPEERRSLENGIWACFQHGHETDSDCSQFSVQHLRGLKQLAEDRAFNEVHGEKTTIDPATALLEFPHTNTIYELFRLVEPQAYTAQITGTLRTLLPDASKPSNLLDLCAEMIIAAWVPHRKIAGILSTLLSQSGQYWHPKRLVTEKLATLCNYVTNQDDRSRIDLVEPLAFALASKRYPLIHKKVLERLTRSIRWRQADSDRLIPYYGGTAFQVTAIRRHLDDAFRQGLQQANDVARVIHLLESDAVSNTANGRHTLLELLDRQIRILSNAGAQDLARTTNELAVAFRFAQKDPSQQH